MSITLEGLDQFRAYLTDVLGGQIQVGLTRILDESADSALSELQDATPLGKTHMARAGWHKTPVDANTVIVSNSTVRTTGHGAPFSYPSALTTGTGDRGVDTTGYSFGFAIGWTHSMPPNPDLHSTWERLANTPMTQAQIGPTPAGLLEP